MSIASDNSEWATLDEPGFLERSATALRRASTLATQAAASRIALPSTCAGTPRSAPRPERSKDGSRINA